MRGGGPDMVQVVPTSTPGAMGMGRTLLATAAVLFAATPVVAQRDRGPFHAVDPLPLPLDRAGVWTLHFAYLPPRITTVDTPEGKRTAWYMVYKVWNTGDTPHTFVPELELVTKDGELRTFFDRAHPMALKQIRKLEDPSVSAEKPTGELNIQSSVAISQTKIPVTKPDSVPRAVYGVAIWLDVPKLAGDVNNFSVYVGGLSNGLAVSESDGGVETISRKTLQIDFFRPTSGKPMLDDIKVNDNNGLGAEKWIYRVTPVAKKAAAPEAKKDGK
jgi:hypothetical protein